MSDVPLIKQFLRHQSDFMSYLMAITRDFDAAEEIFQNAAIVVMERSSDDEPIRDFRAWAKEVVRRQALRHLREQAKEQWVRSLEPILLEQISRADAIILTCPLTDETRNIMNARSLSLMQPSPS